jgi:dGTPase
MQSNSKKYLNLKISTSKGRLFKEKKSSLRTPFQRDRDRIIHSASFRRLKHKTQVFVNTEGDHYRTRLTHSMEVSQISRTIARALNLNEDLCETLSLAHDMGHTPFGHAGEDVLNDCMENYGGFDHNIQTLRIVTVLEEKYYNFKGLNLTIEALDGLIKHNGPINDTDRFNKILGLNTFKNKINFKKYPYLESQISSISDDIAYNNHDVEDGIRANLFTFNKIAEIPFFKIIFNKHKKNIKKSRKELIISQVIRESINHMVTDIIENTKKNINKYKIKSLNNIYICNKPIVCFSSKMQEVDRQIKYFLNHNMYNNKYVLQKANEGKEIIKNLFNNLNKNPKKYIRNDLLKTCIKERAIADFIAGMTDRFAINLNRNFK